MAEKTRTVPIVSPPLDSELLALQEACAGRFAVERELGRGGMGIVVQARDVALDRAVAIKLLPITLARRSELRARFLREARIAAGFSHPHIVPIGTAMPATRHWPWLPGRRGRPRA